MLTIKGTFGLGLGPGELRGEAEAEAETGAEAAPGPVIGGMSLPSLAWAAAWAAFAARLL